MIDTTPQATVITQLQGRFGQAAIRPQATRDGILTFWTDRRNLRAVLEHLKTSIEKPYPMLYDLAGLDECERRHRPGQPDSRFTVVYQLLSFDRNDDVRVKTALDDDSPGIPTVTDLWPNADWYERELWDMFGIEVEGHPHMRRILMPPWWEGHPLRRDHPARATETGIFGLSRQQQTAMQETLRFRPQDWGLPAAGVDFDYMFLNVGPHHPGTHGLLRIILQTRGEEILQAICDIGYHHRGAEKMGERQSWHTYIPYTDRVDYLGGVMNNFPYCMAVEALAGIEVPDRAQVIRILLAELFRISSHLVFYGTFSQDVGQMSPVFHMFTDREMLLGIIEAITGARMHPNWFRIGGVAQDLPEGWDRLVRDFLEYMPRRLREYDQTVLGNRIFRERTRGIGRFSTRQGIAWGATGPMLRSTGLAWDLRKARPYSGYDQLDFDVPVGVNGDCYDRAFVHAEEMRQSLRIIEQCWKNMPSGAYKSHHPLTTPPLKERTMHDIETLIDHFLGVSWGPVIPPGEAMGRVEGTKGAYSYSLISDGNTMPYRVRIRTASFPHIQMLPLLTRHMHIPDLVAVLGSIDFVLADVDR